MQQPPSWGQDYGPPTHPHHQHPQHGGGYGYPPQPPPPKGNTGVIVAGEMRTGSASAVRSDTTRPAAAL